jgi:hypothetical protein
MIRRYKIRDCNHLLRLVDLSAKLFDETEIFLPEDLAYIIENNYSELFPSDYGLIMRMKRYGDGYILHLRRKDAV